jgi:hypothetical protein
MKTRRAVLAAVVLVTACAVGMAWPLHSLRESAWASPDVAKTKAAHEPKALSLAQAASFSSLPTAAQLAISATIGRDLSDYQARLVNNGGFEMVNSKRRLSVEFAQSGVAVHVGDSKGAGWDLALQGYGRGKSINLLSSAAPQANANRVEYHRGDLTEWYVNGPVGLEQGFTLARPPRLSAGYTDKPLTIVLTLSGDLTPSLDSTGTALTLKQRDGEAVLRYTGLSAQDAAGKQLKCWLELHRSQLLLRISDASARYPLVVDPFMQVAELSVTGGPGYFGLSTAISDDGRVIAVGACGYDSAAGLPSCSPAVGANGNVYVFIEPSTGGWATLPAPAAILHGPNPISGNAGDGFGNGVAISGNGYTLAVAAPYYGCTASYSQCSPVVYVYTATTEGVFSNPPIALTDPSDVLTSVIAIDGTGSTVVVRAYNSAEEQSCLDLFLRPSSGTWGNATENAQLQSSGTGVNFGTTVAISEDSSTIVAGDFGIDSQAGAAYVFAEPPASWSSLNPLNQSPPPAPTPETVELVNSDSATNGGFGFAVAVDQKGDTIAVDAAFQNADQGEVYVFSEPTGGWLSAVSPQRETTRLEPTGTYVGLGTNLSISDDGSQITAGSSNSYVWLLTEPTTPTTAWPAGSPSPILTNNGVQLVPPILPDTGDITAFFGYVSGNAVASEATGTVLISYPGNNYDQGAVFVYGVPVSAGPEYMIATGAGSGQSALVGMPFAAQLSATVLDGSGNPPTSPVTVTFTAPSLATDASGTFADSGTATTSATTNASGVATASVFTANGTAGPYTVTATAPNVTGTANFLLRNLAAPVQTATTVTAAPTSTVVGQEVVLTATVTALSGTSAPPGSVTFTSDDGTTIPAAPLSAVPQLAATAAGVTNTSELTLGMRTITATYAPATGFVGSQGTVQVTILPAAPVFTPSGGGLFPGQTVTIAAATGASIYYTLDGSLPTANSTLYTAPIAISGTSPVTIEAIAVESGVNSEVSIAVFNPLPQQQLAIAPGFASVYQNLALQNPVGLRAVVDKNGDFFELSYSTPDLYSIDSSGNSAQFSPNSTAFCGLALSPDGTTLGVSTCDSRVWLLAPELGAASGFTGSLVNFPLVFPASAADSMHTSGALAWGGPNQHLFVVDNSDLHILEFDSQGNYVQTLNEGANRDAMIDSIAVDAAGNLYFAENLPTGGMLMEIPAGGTLKTLSPALAGTSQTLQLNLIDDMTTDAAGNLYFVDNNGTVSSTYSEIYMLNSAGAATAIAGNALNAVAQSSLASGASGPAWDVNLTYPTGVAVNPQGQIYIGQSAFVYFDDTLNAQVDFGGIDPLTQTISAYNPYASPIGLSQITISGTNAADFQIGQLSGCSTTSATTVNPGASCSIPVTFSPSTASTETAMLTLSFAGNATETIGLSGSLIPTTTQLQMVPSTAQSGVPLVTTVQVTPAYGSTSSLTGTVSITDTYTAPGASAPTVVTYTSNADNSPVITLHGAGTHTLAASYSGDPDHSGSATSSYPVTVTLQMPVINWLPPAPMTLGSPLTAIQLDAMVAPGVTGPVPAGTLTYTPPFGTLVHTLGSESLSVSFTPTDSLDFAGASDTVNVSVTKDVPSISVVTPTATYGASETIVITVTGVLGLVPTGAVVLTLDSTQITIPAASSTSTGSSSATYAYNAGVLSGGTHTVEVEYPGDNNYALAVVTGPSLSFTIAPAATTVSLSSSSITTDENTPVTLTAIVSSTAGAIPNGDGVSFYSGTTFLGARMTSNGIATFPASFVTAGTFSLTATYMGDIDFSTSTSQPILQVVVTPDYTIGVNPPSLTIVQGQTGTAVFTVTSIAGYSTPISFACNGLPQYATCAFDPASVTPTAAGATTTLTIQTDVAQASLSPVRESRPGSRAQGKLLASGTLAAVFLLFCCGTRSKMLRRLRLMNARRLLWLAAILASGWIVTSCGGSSVPKTPAGQNTLTITASGGSGSSADVHTVSLNVTISQ